MHVFCNWEGRSVQALRTNTTKHQINDSSTGSWSIWPIVSKFWTLAVLLVLIVIFSTIKPSFLSAANWFSTTNYMIETLLLAIAETFVIITAGIDLSVGAIEGLANVTASLVILSFGGKHSIEAILIGILVGLVVGCGLGFVNGVVITKLKITPFITTLGMMGVATGLTFILSGGTSVSGLPSLLSVMGNHQIFGIFTFPVLVSIIVLIIAWIVLSQTRFGLYTYAVGSNLEGARRSGINVDRHLIKVYTMSGGIAALSGVLLLMQFATGSPLTGSNSELNAIAAVVIGGVSLFGGEGSMIGSLIGSAIIAVIITGLVIINVQPYWQMAAIGVIIVLAVWIDQLRKKRA
jgi:ribose transport system permease protein